MRHILIILSLLLLSSPLFGQSERPETIIVPVSGIGDVSNTRKLILENTLTNELKKHFRIVPQKKYKRVLEQVFQELEYEECSDDICIMRVQEMLQVENVFNLQVIGEGDDTQLNLEWITLDEKKNETDVCLGCGTFQLNDKVMGLVEKLVGVKVFEKPVVVEKRIEPVVKVGKRKKGILFDIGVDEWKWIVNGDEKTDGKYEGEIKNGKPDGKGYFSKPKWGSFDGRWSDGNPSQGTEKWYNGNEYSGEYNKNGIHGQGTFTWSDGGKYVGEWKDDKRTGQGTFTYPNGGKYIGEFKDNKMNGQGTFTTSDGDSFRGSWKDDNFQEGVFKSSEGSIFSGEMRHQLPWNGIQYDKNGNFVRRFKNGKKGY